MHLANVLLISSLTLIQSRMPDYTFDPGCKETLPVGSSLNFYYVTSAKNMDAIANTPSAIAAAISLKPKVHFKLYYTDKDESNIGARLGVCAMHQYPYPHNLNALSFISCVSTKHIEMREKAFESRPSSDCAGFSVAATLDCLSNQVAVSTSKFFETESVKICAQNTSVAWEPLNTCATSHQGETLLKTNTAAAAQMLANQYNADSKSKGFGGGSVLSDIGSRRLLSPQDDRSMKRGLLAKMAPTTHLLFGDLNPFKSTPKKTPAEMAKVQESLAAPAVAVFGDVAKYVFPSNMWNVTKYESFMCKTMKQQQPTDSATADVWTWIAGTAISVSAILAGVGVAILFHKEKDWMKPGAFDRPADTHPNRHQLVTLKENGEVDQAYEKTLTVPNLPYLNGPWAKGSHKRWMTNTEGVDKAMYT